MTSPPRCSSLDRWRSVCSTSGDGRADSTLLALTFAALLLAGEIDGARSTGAELYELALRFDTSKLYTVLDAMAFLACEEHRYEVAARIAACADLAHAARGEARRRPAEERMRTAVMTALSRNPGDSQHAAPADSRDSLDEATACSLALGLCALSSHTQPVDSPRCPRQHRCTLCRAVLCRQFFQGIPQRDVAE